MALLACAASASAFIAMAIETRSNGCHPQDEGTSILDVSDPTNPREVAFINR